MNSLGEDGSHLFGAIVIFARADVTAATVEIEMRALWFILLALLARQPGEVRADSSISVVAHGVTQVLRGPEGQQWHILMQELVESRGMQW